MKILDKNEVILNGRYLVTDPCYVYQRDDDERWSQFCRLLWDEKGDITIFEIDGKEIPVMSTCYGDGSYSVIVDNQTVGRFGVDAGLFCFIPWEAESDESRTMGPVVDIQGKLTYSNGDAYLNGNIIVDTSGESFEEEED